MRPLHTLLTLAIVLPTIGCGEHMHSGDDAEGGVDATYAAPSDTAVLGQPAPDFELTDTTGTTHKLSDYAGKIVVLEWFNPGCPVTQQYHNPASKSFIADRGMAATFEQLGDSVVWLAINSGAPGNQGHGVELNSSAIQDFSIKYPVLMDESGSVGRAYEAETTPHMYVIAEDGVLLYNGAIDNGSTRGTGDKNFVVEAIAAIREGRPCSPAQTAPFGCSVKYGS